MAVSAGKMENPVVIQSLRLKFPAVSGAEGLRIPGELLLLSQYGKPEETSSNIREGMPQQQAKKKELSSLLPCLDYHQKVPVAEEWGWVFLLQ